jgi:hypothetical protein
VEKKTMEFKHPAHIQSIENAGAYNNNIKYNNNKINDNPIQHPQQRRYTEQHETKTGHLYTRHIKDEEDMIIKRIQSDKLQSTPLDKMYVDPYKVNDMIAFDVSQEEINSFDDKIKKDLIHNQKFLQSSYSSIAKNNYNPSIDLWNQSQYRDEKYQRLYLNKIVSEKTQNNNTKHTSKQSILSPIFSTMTSDMEYLLMQHNFVRETLIYFLPKLQYHDVEKRKPMSISSFILLHKNAGLFIDSKEKERSGISIVNIVQVHNKIKKETTQINLTFRYCEMQTEYVEKSSEDKNKNDDSDDILNDVRTINNISNSSTNYIELNKMSMREIDDFMEDNLRCNIILIVQDNHEAFKKMISEDQKKLTMKDIEMTKSNVKISQFVFNVI